MKVLSARRGALAGLAGIAVLALVAAVAVTVGTSPPTPRAVDPPALNGQGPPASVPGQTAAATVGATVVPAPPPPNPPAPAGAVWRGEAGAAQADLERAPPPVERGVSRFDATKGTRVRFGTKEVQLPPDVGIAGELHAENAYARTADGAPQPGAGGARPEADFWIVKRGDAEAHVGKVSGRLAGVVPPERAADFAWLAEALS
jgi:hypothetical protein